MARLSCSVINRYALRKVRRIFYQRQTAIRYISQFTNLQLQIRRINLLGISKIKIRTAHIPRISCLHLAQRNSCDIFCIIHCIDQAPSVVAGLDSFLLCAVQRHAFISVGSKRMLVVSCVSIIVHAVECCAGKQTFRLRC